MEGGGEGEREEGEVSGREGGRKLQKRAAE